MITFDGNKKLTQVLQLSLELFLSLHTTFTNHSIKCLCYFNLTTSSLLRQSNPLQSQCLESLRNLLWESSIQLVSMS